MAHGSLRREVTAMSETISVLLVDDHPVVREGLRTMLASEPDMEVVGEASSGEEALQKVGPLRPQVVLMDIRMPGMGGIAATQRIKEAQPTIAVIMLTMYDSEMYVVEAVRSGAAGYLLKDASRELMCHAVRAAVDGGVLIRSGLLRLASRGLGGGAYGLAQVKEQPNDVALTPRELEVLRLLAQGHGNKEVARELYLAEVTVKKYVQAIIGKLNASDRTHAAIKALRLGIIE